MVVSREYFSEGREGGGFGFPQYNGEGGKNVGEFRLGEARDGEPIDVERDHIGGGASAPFVTPPRHCYL